MSRYVSGYIDCNHAARPEEITELEPLLSSGMEYLVRVVFREGDEQLAGHLFPEEAMHEPAA